MHRAVWVANNGPIPDGWHVHHLDGNAHNNDIANLKAIDGAEHNRSHGLIAEHLKSPERLELLDRIRADSHDWMKDPERLKALSESVRAAWNNKERVSLTCQFCGAEFESPQPKSRYCAPECKQGAKNVKRRKTPMPLMQSNV